MKRSVKILSFIFAFVILLGAIPFSTFAATSVISNSIETSYVTDDLRAMGYNLGNYPKDTSADFVSVINFLEHGYSANGDQRYYGLYLYLYSPTGKVLDMDECRLQMAYKNKDGLTNYVKYYLTVCSVSLDSYSNLFYKLKVEGTTKLVRDINKGFRHYSLSGIELKFQGESIVDFPLEQSWTYTGYQENFGEEKGKSSLYCTKDEVEVIRTELQSASWFSYTSDLGEDYRYELSSVYFNIPTYFIKKYGNLDDKPSNGGTSGLHAVRGEYYKYATNGLVVPDHDWYLKFAGQANTDISKASRYNWSYVPGLPGFYASNVNYVAASKELIFDFSHNMKTGSDSKGLYTHHSRFTQNRFAYLIESSTGFVDAVDFLNIYSNNKVHVDASGLRIGSLLKNVGQHVPYYITVEDESFNSAIKSYASTRQGYLGNWIHKLFNKELYVDEKGYPDIKPIVEVTSSDLNGKGDETVADNLFIMENDAARLREFYDEKEDNNHIYLMRFEVNPYYCPEVVLTSTNDRIVGADTSGNGTGYYFEKAVFEKFDVLEFTFKNKEGKFTTVPVSCDPIDIVGSIIPGNNQTYPNPNGNDDPTDDELGWWEIVLLVITIILFIVGIILLVWILSKILGFFAPAVEFAERREDRKLDKRRRRLEDARLEMEEKKLREEHEWHREDRDEKKRKKDSKKKTYESPKAKVQSEDEYFEEELKKYNKKHKEKK